MQEKVISLGKALVEELGLEPGVDTRATSLKIVSQPTEF